MDFLNYYRMFVVICLAVFAGACVNSGNYNHQEKSGYGYGSKSKQTVKQDANETITVTIKNFAYEPARLTLSVGDTLVFVNEDSAPHTATSISGAFDTGQIEAGESATVSIAESGSYEYICTIHPSMKGAVVVQ